MLKHLSIAYAGGALGGLTNSLAVWLFGAAGITALLGVGIAPALTPTWLYPRIVWGGLWGLLFLIPWRTRSWALRAFVLSLGPTAIQLFVVFPFKADKGVAGLELGILTPLLVVLFNLIWGLTAAAWIKAAHNRPPR